MYKIKRLGIFLISQNKGNVERCDAIDQFSYSFIFSHVVTYQAFQSIIRFSGRAGLQLYQRLRQRSLVPDKQNGVVRSARERLLRRSPCIRATQRLEPNVLCKVTLRV